MARYFSVTFVFQLQQHMQPASKPRCYEVACILRDGQLSERESDLISYTLIQTYNYYLEKDRHLRKQLPLQRKETTYKDNRGGGSVVLHKTSDKQHERTHFGINHQGTKQSTFSTNDQSWALNPAALQKKLQQPVDITKLLNNCNKTVCRSTGCHTFLFDIVTVILLVFSDQHCQSNCRLRDDSAPENAHLGKLKRLTRTSLSMTKMCCFLFYTLVKDCFYIAWPAPNVMLYRQPLRQELKSKRNSLHALGGTLAKEGDVPQSTWGTASCITSLPLCKVWRPPANTPLGSMPVGVKPLSVSTFSLSSLELRGKKGKKRKE